MKTYLEHRGNTNGVENNKFYEVETKNNKLYCRWGSTHRYEALKNKYIETSGIKILTKDISTKYHALILKKQRRGYNIIQTNSVRVETRPTNTGRKFGVEIETNTNLRKSVLCKLLKDRGLKARSISGYTTSNGDKWDIKNDSSCGYEIASPILSGPQGIFDLKLAVDKIKDALLDTHMPDDRCGIHITVDVSDFNKVDIKRLIIGFLKAQHHFFDMCNESRQNNTYCKKYNISKIDQCIRATTVSKIQSILNICKYRGLNLTKLSDKVVEFRMFQSELSARKITEWVRVCVGFIEGMKTENISFTTDSKLSSVKFKSFIKTI
jgi:predicted DNA-binding WGR domain protein